MPQTQRPSILFRPPRLFACGKNGEIHLKEIRLPVVPRRRASEREREREGVIFRFSLLKIINFIQMLAIGSANQSIGQR